MKPCLFGGAFFLTRISMSAEPISGTAVAAGGLMGASVFGIATGIDYGVKKKSPAEKAGLHKAKNYAVIA